MNEHALIEAMNEVLMNHETGPLSNLGCSLALNEDEQIVEVETAARHPFSDSIDTPQLVREFMAAAAPIIREDMRAVMLDRFAADAAASPAEFSASAANAVCDLIGGGR